MLLLLVLYLTVTVTNAAARRRGHRSPVFGVAAAVLAVILQFPIYSLIWASEPEVVAAGGILATAAVIIVLLLIPEANARARAKETSFPYAALGVLCAVLAAVHLAFYSLAVVFEIEAGIMAWFGAVLFFSGAISCFQFHRRTRVPRPAEVLARDPRPPVLLLRSFSSDQVRLRGPLSVLLPLLPSSSGTSFEEWIAPTFRQFGPFIALGDPEDYLPTLGAAKVYRSDESWQRAVLHFLSIADLVIVLEGETEGLSWELRQIRRSCPPDKVFVITPSRKFPYFGWTKFATLMKGAGFNVPERAGPGTVIGFDTSFNAVVLADGAYCPQDFAQAIGRWRSGLTMLPQACSSVI